MSLFGNTARCLLWGSAMSFWLDVYGYFGCNRRSICVVQVPFIDLDGSVSC